MWPLEFTELKHIEDLLVCGICYDYMETSVITSCSHNYCSLCIRKYLHYKTQCPACFSETFERDLRKNKALDEIITYFVNVKKKLRRCLQGTIDTSKDNTEDDVAPKPKGGDANSRDTPTSKQLYKSAIVERNFCQTPTSRQGNKTDKNLCQTPSSREENKINKNLSQTPTSRQENKVISSDVPNNNSSPCSTKSSQGDLYSPSTSGQLKLAVIFTPKSKKDVANSEDTKVVVCPVCKVAVSETNINRHLDDCLKREAIKERPQTVVQKRKPLPKLVLSLMKDTEIRKKLKELGLPSQGDRKTLESRLQKYTILYNAECDKTHPRPVSELIKQCEEEESVEKKANKTTPTTNRLQVNRNTEKNVIENERKKYLEAHKDSFESLISKIKRTGTTKKTAKRSELGGSTNSNVDVPHKRQAIIDESNDSIEDNERSDFQSRNYDDVDVQDSDSDNSCPLQTYSSTDPLKSLNVGLSSPLKDNTTQNMGAVNRTIKEEFKSSDSPRIKVETDVILHDELHIQAEAVSQKDTRKYDLKDICSTPKSKTTLQRRSIICQRDEIKRMDSIGVTDLKARLLKQEAIEDENRPTVLQDFMCDLSSNDSFESKSNYGRLCTAENRFPNDDTTKFSNFEKENISSSPELTERRPFRKRGLESIQSGNKAVSNKKKKSRISSICLNETGEESVAGILHDNENGRLRKNARSKKHDTVSPKENTTVVRKSNRTRFKTKILLK